MDEELEAAETGLGEVEKVEPVEVPGPPDKLFLPFDLVPESLHSGPCSLCGQAEMVLDYLLGTFRVSLCAHCLEGAVALSEAGLKERSRLEEERQLESLKKAAERQKKKRSRAGGGV